MCISVLYTGTRPGYTNAAAVGSVLRPFARATVMYDIILNRPETGSLYKSNAKPPRRQQQQRKQQTQLCAAAAVAADAVAAVASAACTRFAHLRAQHPYCVRMCTLYAYV